MKTNILIFFLITLLKSQIHDWHGFQVDLSRFENKTDSSVMRMNGEVVGSWVWSIEKKGELLIVKDKSILTGKIEERVYSEINYKKLNVNKFNTAMEFTTTTVESKLSWNENHLSGEFIQRKLDNEKRSPIDTTFTGVIPRLTFIALMPYIHFKPDEAKSINLFLNESGSVWEVNMSVHPDQEIKIESGKYMTDRIDMIRTNQGISNRFYVTKTKPYRIVKVDVIEQGMTINFIKPLINRNL